MNTSLPSDPEIIKEYLEILRAIARERQVYNPLPVKILLDAIPIETDRARHILIRIVERDVGIKLFFKNEVTVDPLRLDPYEKMEQVEYVEVFDEEKFKEYLKQFLGPLDEQSAPSQDLPSADDQQKIDWQDDFRWEGNTFIFGGYGKIDFSSEDRKALLRVLTDAKGNWVAVSKLKGNKDANYVRATIKQIEDRMEGKLKKHITIPSTQDDDVGNKPLQGAYRIKFVSNPK